MSETVERAVSAGRRSALYWLLGDIALTSPDRAFVDRLQRELSALPGDVEPLAVSLGRLRDALPHSGDEAGIEHLAVDYTRLFGGLRAGYGLPPPLESTSDESAAQPEVPFSLAASYADAGFGTIDERAPADHLGVEMKFFAFLCHVEMLAWQSERRDEVRCCRERQRRFCDAHLSRWAPDRWRVTATSAEHPFYRLAADIAVGALREDAATLFEQRARGDRQFGT